MIRYRLSRLFTRFAERHISGDMGVSAQELMADNRNHYRDELITSLEQFFHKFDSKLVLEHQLKGMGKATLELSAPSRYPNADPVEFTLNTECSDFLVATGRLAAFEISPEEGKPVVFYYGNSHEPDNTAQSMHVPPYLGDVNKIAQYLHGETFAHLFNNHPKNAFRHQKNTIG